MMIRLKFLRLLCKRSSETIEFAERVSFFHGEMSAGKSSIPALIDYCLGSKFPRTPALDSELLSVQLSIRLNEYDVLIERVPTEVSRIQMTWTDASGVAYQCTAPLQKAQGAQPIVDEDIYTFSDLILSFLGIDILRVRKRRQDEESPLVRLSIRDLLEFSYLDQDHLDSDFFLLSLPMRKEKSQDSLRYFAGYLSETLNRLQIELQDLRLEQRAKREAVGQIKEFLARFGYASEEKIEGELSLLSAEARNIDDDLKKLADGYQPERYVREEDQDALRKIGAKIDNIDTALIDLKGRIDEQEALEAELIALKFKNSRVNVARNVLDKAQFEICPACGSDLPEHKHNPSDHCYLCQTPSDRQPKLVSTDVDVIRQDLDARILDIRQSLSYQRKSIPRLQQKRSDLVEERSDVNARMTQSVKAFESEYARRTRAHEIRLSAIRERTKNLEEIRAMPAEIAKVYDLADAISAKIDNVKRQMEEESNKLVSAEANFIRLQDNYKDILLRIDFPGVTERDMVVLNRRTMIPEIWPGGNEEKAWTFFEAGSGGKKTLLKICFALSLHKTAAERGLPVPNILMIDSPMKNITPDINRSVFDKFYSELYRLLEFEMREWQILIVDQTYAAPPEALSPHMNRRLTRNDPNFPPLISYYSGP